MTPASNVSDLNGQVKGFSTSTENTLNNLALKLTLLKDESSALSTRIKDIESRIVKLCGHKPEGISKFNSENFQVSTTGKLTRKISDLDTLSKLAPQLIVNKPALNMKEFNQLSRTNPVLMQKVLGCIETKEAKTAVAIKPLVQE